MAMGKDFKSWQAGKGGLDTWTDGRGKGKGEGKEKESKQMEGKRRRASRGEERGKVERKGGKESFR